MARPLLLRGNRRRTEFGSAAIGTERDRGEGLFRCARAGGVRPRRGLDGKLYLNLGDEKWRAVEIDTTGWRLIDKPSVSAGLPHEAVGDARPGRIGRYPALVSEPGPTPTSCWWSPGRLGRVCAIGVPMPCACTVSCGRTGSAKSTFLAMMRSFCSIRHRRPCRARGSRHVHRWANNDHVLAFDNVSVPGYRTRFAGSRPVAASPSGGNPHRSRTRCLFFRRCQAGDPERHRGHRGDEARFGSIAPCS